MSEHENINEILRKLEQAVGKLKQVIQHRHRAVRLRFVFRWQSLMITGDNMQATFQVGKTPGVIGSPVDANLNPSAAVLSNTVYTSSDATVFTVAPDPNNIGAAIMTGIGAGTATLTETALATEPDGTTTETIQGVATIIVTVAPPPPPPVAASIEFTFSNLT